MREIDLYPAAPEPSSLESDLNTSLANEAGFPPSERTKTAVLNGLSDLVFPKERIFNDGAVLQPTGEYTKEILDRGDGRAAFFHPEWGEIDGYLVPTGRGGTFFKADNAIVQTDPSNIGSTTVVLSGANISPKVKIGQGTIIGIGTVLKGNLSIGSYCEIQSGCRLHGGTAPEQSLNIGNRVIIGAETRIGPGTKGTPFIGEIEDDVEIGIKTSITGHGFTIGSRVRLHERVALEGASVASDVEIGKDSTVFGEALPQATLRRDLPDRSFIEK